MQPVYGINAVQHKTMWNYEINNILKMNRIAQDINLTYFTLTNDYSAIKYNYLGFLKSNVKK